MSKDELPPGHCTPWTVYGKVYRGCLPLLCLVAAMCYIDRTNLAYASFSMTKELNFSPTVYGAGRYPREESRIIHQIIGIAYQKIGKHAG
jgi:hypothetical protein